MRMTHDMLYQQFLRNINAVGTTDANIQADFNANLGQTYQLMLSKLANYKTENYTTTFKTGMNAILLSTGASQAISGITSSGTTATVTLTAHGYSTSNSVAISGASPDTYNGTFTITVVDANTFTYTLPSATTSPAAFSQFVPYPPGEITIDGMFITVGSVNYPLQIVDSMMTWNQLNAVLLQASTLPQFYFPRKSDFGIWPIPQSSYNGTIQYHYRDRNLTVSDYTTGTVAVTQNSRQIVGTGTTFTPAMVGRWFSITDTTAPGQGFWYSIISYTDATHLNLNQPYTGTTEASATYIIGESPEIPEEGHMTLVDGVTMRFYQGMRKDPDNAAKYANLFWTGDLTNTNRKIGNSEIAGGLIGLMNRYSDRDDTKVITRQKRLNPLNWKPWSTSITSS